MALIGLYSGAYILKHKDERGFKLGRSRQTAKSAYNGIVKKYGTVKPGSKYRHVGKGVWRIYSISNDRKRTGKTTTDKKKWAKQPHKLDFKGVDTKRTTKAAQKIKKYRIGKTWDSGGYKRKIIGYWDKTSYVVSDNKDGAFKKTGYIIKFKDIDSEIAFDKKAFISWKKSQVAEKAKAKKAEKEREEYEFTHGFADGFPAMRKSRALKTLNATQLYNNKPFKRKDFIIMKVKDGWTVGKDGKGKRVLEKGLNSYATLSKTELDYAEYLRNKGIGPKKVKKENNKII